MNRTAAAISVALATALTASAAQSSELPWLAGYWLDCDGKSVAESWIDTGSDTLTGVSLTRERTRTSFEFMRIARQADGALAFFASPGGAPATQFREVSRGDQRVAFENRAHDFPRRVIYRREGETLYARVEGLIDGKQVSMDWTYRSAAANAACLP